MPVGVAAAVVAIAVAAVTGERRPSRWARCQARGGRRAVSCEAKSLPPFPPGATAALKSCWSCSTRATTCLDRHYAAVPLRCTVRAISSSEICATAQAHLGVVVGAAAALEALDRLALAGGLGERLAARGHLGVAAAELGGGVEPAPLRALHPRLGGEEVGARGAGAQDGVAAGVARGGDDVGGLAQHRLAADAVRQLAGELLAGLVLRALAQRPDPLEAEGEGRGLHVRVHRPAGRRLEPAGSARGSRVRAGPRRSAPWLDACAIGVAGPLEARALRGRNRIVMHVIAADGLRLDMDMGDYFVLAVYFIVVLGIGFAARRGVASSLDFFLSGRSLPAWVTGLAFVSANLGAIELLGMAANGAQYGLPTLHYYWIGAIPAMVFLGLVMMPFYYGSKVRSVPEYLRLRFNKPTHLFNALTFAFASVLIAGVNLFALALIMQALLGWSLALSIVVAAFIVLAYTTLGGLTAAVYNEVLQFFVIVLFLVPLTVVALVKIGGWDDLTAQVRDSELGDQALNAWQGTSVGSSTGAFGNWIAIVFGLGFVLSFGYWTTNFAEVQRALSAKNMNAARLTPIIGAWPKLLIPFVIIIPGLIASQLISGPRRRGRPPVQQRDPADGQPAVAQRRAGDRHDRPAGRLHGRHGGQRELVQHGRHLRHHRALHQAGHARPLVPAHGPHRHGLRRAGGHRHRVHRVGLHEHHGLHPAAVLVLQRPAVRHLHHRPVLEAGDPVGGDLRPRGRHARRRGRPLPQRVGGHRPRHAAGGGLLGRRRRLHGRRGGHRPGLPRHAAQAGGGAARARVVRDAGRAAPPAPRARRTTAGTARRRSSAAASSRPP